MPRANQAAVAASSAQAQQDAMVEAEGIDHYELPKALVTRIAKSALPPNAKFNKDTITGLTRGATVFINYLSATAQDVAHSKSHKTIAASDVLKALELVDIPDMVELLQHELDVYRHEQKNGNKGKGKPALGPAPAPAGSANGAAAADGQTKPAYYNEHASTARETGTPYSVYGGQQAPSSESIDPQYLKNAEFDGLHGTGLVNAAGAIEEEEPYEAEEDDDTQLFDAPLGEDGDYDIDTQDYSHPHPEEQLY